ncbi:MAG: aminopeptidase P family protein [Pseudomonadota bacterium]
MFQQYTSTSEREAGPARLTALSAEMRKNGVSHFLVPHADEYQNEYLPKRAERLAWITGFTGSAGFAIATCKGGHVFVDGRYTLQAASQVDPDAFTIHSLTENPPSKWLKANTSNDDVIGYDPWLITVDQLSTFQKAADKNGARLKQVSNLIDQVWLDQPTAPLGKVSIQLEKHAGRSAVDKLEEIGKSVAESGADFAILTDPASLAWLFNIRGNDVIHNPVPLGYALVAAKGKAVIFMDKRKLDRDVLAYINPLADLAAPDELAHVLSIKVGGHNVLCDMTRVPVALIEMITAANGKTVKGRDPVTLPRAIKNAIEIKGAKTAQIRDGVAMCRFLHWLDMQSPEKVSEISAAKQLEEFRTSTAQGMGAELKEISFDTISGHGPNGAIVHYRVTHESDRTFTPDSIYLCDSGGQYQDGTTDITRTVVIGKADVQASHDFTLVLKGHIAIAMARFPQGTRGVDLDPLARQALWSEGKDFAHGTGHGVGAYLNVHEGPQSISKRGTEPLMAGMIISNEPGFYVEGKYGIRIENLVLVSPAETIEGGNIPVHKFETLTLCPIDLRLVKQELLLPHERNWLNEYHKRVRDTLAPYLKPDEQAWLTEATRAV